MSREGGFPAGREIMFSVEFTGVYWSSVELRSSKVQWWGVRAPVAGPVISSSEQAEGLNTESAEWSLRARVEKPRVDGCQKNVNCNLPIVAASRCKKLQVAANFQRVLG